tara:strand:- start:12147 stop:13052 length:906 start_codon:yes stop_codon:yes gene_type:complete
MVQTILTGEDQGLFKDFEGTAISQSLGPIAKESLQNGLFDVTDTKDLWGNDIKTMAAFKNPHTEKMSQIHSSLYNGNGGSGWNGLNSLPFGWDSSSFSTRATVTELGRPMTDAEIFSLQSVNGILNDFNMHTNIQSGVNQTDYGQANPFSFIGGVQGGSTYSLPNGHRPQPIGQMLSIGQSINAINTALGAAAAVGTGPCAFLDELFGALSKGGAILNQILNFLSSALGLLNLIAGIIGYITQLARMILEDLAKLAGAVQRVTNAALSGLIESLLSDPCLRHLLTAGIAGYGLLQTIKKFS